MLWTRTWFVTLCSCTTGSSSIFSRMSLSEENLKLFISWTHTISWHVKYVLLWYVCLVQRKKTNILQTENDPLVVICNLADVAGSWVPEVSWLAFNFESFYVLNFILKKNLKYLCILDFFKCVVRCLLSMLCKYKHLCHLLCGISAKSWTDRLVC